MNLKEQTVYIRDSNSTSSIYVYAEDETFSLSTLENQYILSKEELIELLSKAYNAGVDYDIFDNSPSKEQFINQLIR